MDLIGAIILDHRKVERALGLRMEDFSERKLWDIYSAVLDAVNDGNPDLAKITQKLKEQNAIASFTDLSWYMENTFGGSKPEYMAMQIKTATAKRQTIELFGTAKANMHQDYQTFFDAIESGLSDIKKRLKFGKDFKTIKKALLDYFDDMEGRYNGVIVPKIVHSGYKNLDNITGGFRGGDLCVIGARTGMGKSAAMLNIAARASKKGRVAIFSLEMSEAELSERLLAEFTSIDSMTLRNKPQTLGDRDFQNLASAVSVLAQKHDIMINDNGSTTVLDVRSKSRQLHAEKPLSCVIVDHIGIMSGGMKFESKRVETSFMSGRLKALAKELDIPVVVLAQLNRGEQGERPKMSSLKESGSLEEDANQVILLHRPDYFCAECQKRDPENPCRENHKGLAEWIVAKNRGGPTGIATMMFVPEFSRFSEVDFNHN